MSNSAVAFCHYYLICDLVVVAYYYVVVAIVAVLAIGTYPSARKEMVLVID